MIDTQSHKSRRNSSLLSFIFVVHTHVCYDKLIKRLFLNNKKKTIKGQKPFSFQDPPCNLRRPEFDNNCVICCNIFTTSSYLFLRFFQYFIWFLLLFILFFTVNAMWRSCGRTPDMYLADKTKQEKANKIK